MNMNEQEWNEIWDEEPDEDDEFNDFGSDVDANNDETFDNAAEWNEDEHEELIARDSILSHTIRSNNSTNNNNNNNNNSSSGSRHHAGNNNSSRSSSDLGHGNNRINPGGSSSSSSNHNIQRANPMLANNGNAEACFLAMVQGDYGPAWGRTNADRGLFPIQEKSIPSAQSAVGPTELDQVLRNAERYIQSMNQQERSGQEQNQNFRGLMNHNVAPPAVTRPASMSGPRGERILTVDELEKQLLKTSLNPNSNEQQPRPHPAELSKRAGWSPFGGKELFTSQEEQQQIQSQLGMGGPNILAHSQLPTTLSIEQQRQILFHQQQQMLQQQQLLQQMTFMKQQQIQAEQRLMAQNPQCFTVEELERQLLANRSATQNQQAPQPNQTHDQNQSETREIIKTDTRIQATPERSNKTQDRAPNVQHNNNNNNHNHRRREGERSERLDYDRHDRDGRENRQNHKDRRDNHRDNNHRDQRQRPKGPIIVPPQVQLSVIEKGKNLHPLASTQGDEFLQDRVPTMKDGFLMKRHSAVARSKPNHDGVLTEKERKWLIQIQEKIQADYDDNMDQDYYYLLYFNRTSKPNENAQKPRRPGVTDRRFIPRERLLYDSTT